MGFIIVVIALLLSLWCVPHLCSPALQSWRRATHLPCMMHTWHIVHETLPWVTFLDYFCLVYGPKCLPQFWRDANSAGPFWITWLIREENKLSFLGPQNNLWQPNGRQLSCRLLLMDSGSLDILPVQNQTKHSAKSLADSDRSKWTRSENALWTKQISVSKNWGKSQELEISLNGL